jgi:hypothetical protein
MSTTNINDGKNGATIVHSNPAVTPTLAGKGTAVVTTTGAAKDGISKTTSAHGEVAGVVFHSPA